VSGLANQVLLTVPANIQALIDSGQLIRTGGVVRDAVTKAIVKHLQDGPDIEAGEAIATATKQLSAKAVASLKNPWVIATLAGTVVAAAITAAVLNNKRNNDKDAIAQVHVPGSIVAYTNALTAYIEAARIGELNELVISDLIAALDEVEADTKAGALAIDFQAEESKSLVSLVIGYTRAVAGANSLDLDALLEQSPVEDDDVLGDLRRHLEVQRGIFAQED